MKNNSVHTVVGKPNCELCEQIVARFKQVGVPFQKLDADALTSNIPTDWREQSFADIRAELAWFVDTVPMVFTPGMAPEYFGYIKNSAANSSDSFAVFKGTLTKHLKQFKRENTSQALSA